MLLRTYIRNDPLGSYLLVIMQVSHPVGFPTYRRSTLVPSAINLASMSNKPIKIVMTSLLK